MELKKYIFNLSLTIPSIMLISLIIIPLLSLYMTVDYKVFTRIIFIKEVLSAIFTTVLAATVATLILSILGFPLAYILARMKFKGKGLVEAIVDLPLAVPHVIVGIMLLLTFQTPTSPLASLVKKLGLRLVDSFLGIVAAMIYVSSPIMIDLLKEGIKSIDPILEGVSRSFGADMVSTFFRVTLPLSIRYLIAGALLSWARAVSEVGSLLILAYYPKTVNILLIEWFHAYGLTYATALAALFLLLCIVCFIALRIIQKEGVLRRRCLIPWR